MILKLEKTGFEKILNSMQNWQENASYVKVTKYAQTNSEYSVTVVVRYGSLNKLALSCKGLCNRIKSVGTAMQFKYREGQKRCSLCELFIDCDDARCPCCKTILRTKSRNRVSKIKGREKSYQ